MDSSDEEGTTPLKDNTSIPNKNAITEKKISTPTKEVRFDSSMLNLSGISSIAGGDSIVAPDPNRSKVTMPKKVRETINLKILQHEKVIKESINAMKAEGERKVVRSNGSPRDKKGDLALRHLRRKISRAYNKVQPAGGVIITRDKFEELLLTLGLFDEKGGSCSNQHVLLSRCFDIASSFIVDDCMDNNKDYTDNVSLGQLDTLMLLIYGYKKASEIRFRIPDASGPHDSSDRRSVSYTRDNNKSYVEGVCANKESLKGLIEELRTRKLMTGLHVAVKDEAYGPPKSKRTITSRQEWHKSRTQNLTELSKPRKKNNEVLIDSLETKKMEECTFKPHIFYQKDK